MKPRVTINGDITAAEGREGNGVRYVREQTKELWDTHGPGRSLRTSDTVEEERRGLRGRNLNEM